MPGTGRERRCRGVATEPSGRVLLRHLSVPAVVGLRPVVEHVVLLQALALLLALLPVIVCTRSARVRPGFLRVDPGLRSPPVAFVLGARARRAAARDAAAGGRPVGRRPGALHPALLRGSLPQGPTGRLRLVVPLGLSPDHGQEPGRRAGPQRLRRAAARPQRLGAGRPAAATLAARSAGARALGVAVVGRPRPGSCDRVRARRRGRLRAACGSLPASRRLQRQRGDLMLKIACRLPFCTCSGRAVLGVTPDAIPGAAHGEVGVGQLHLLRQRRHRADGSR
mmetsp:Transcript_43740/g.129473  ORF Transcript_43740/g.129473 Transcript_43740/m.129473 type:complete len:281 (-) Transcript_43740:1316-2158(-)